MQAYEATKERVGKIGSLVIDMRPSRAWGHARDRCFMSYARITYIYGLVSHAILVCMLNISVKHLYVCQNILSCESIMSYDTVRYYCRKICGVGHFNFSSTFEYSYLPNGNIKEESF